jgi:putative membrane protein
MIRLLAQLTLSVLANAVGLYAAKILVDGFSIDGLSFVIAVAIFSIATTVLGPLITKIALTSAPYLLGGIALVTTFIGLLITTIFSDGIVINGLSTWVISTLVVWVFSVIGSVLLPLVLFKKILAKKSS